MTKNNNGRNGATRPTEFAIDVGSHTKTRQLHPVVIAYLNQVVAMFDSCGFLYEIDLPDGTWCANFGKHAGRRDDAQREREAAAMKPPIVTGQCGEVLNLLRQHESVSSLVLIADHAIPAPSAHVRELRRMGWNISTRKAGSVKFRGRSWRNVEMYSLEFPEWPSPDLVESVLGLGDVERS